jgi:hypothetical protein
MFRRIGFEILTAASVKMDALCVVTPCSVVLVASIVILKMEAARTSETLGNLHQTTRRYNPEDTSCSESLMTTYKITWCHNPDHNMNSHRLENLKSH